MDENTVFRPDHAQRLNDLHRLDTQVSVQDLARLLALQGHEDVIDLGSGTGFYTDLVATLTAGTVYALDVQPEMHDHYRARGVPANVRLILGDMADLSLPPASIDVAYSIVSWHETGGKIDLAGLAAAVRPDGRLVVIDWRRDADSWGYGPPGHIRFTGKQVAGSLLPYFVVTRTEQLGRSMFAVVAARSAPASP